MFRIESCAKQQTLVVDLPEERESAQIRIEQHSNFRWRRAKSWKRCQAWFWIDCNQSLQPNRSQMKCDLSEERASAQIRIVQHSDLGWRRAKAWKRCQAWFWIDLSQGLQPNRSQMKRDVWKPCSDQRWQMELRFWILRFFELSDLVNNHLLCYRPTIHLAISKICPKFQVISSHFFEVDELLSCCSMSIE